MARAYKLLALDMDGTLLDSHKEVSEDTARAISQLAKRGVAIAFSTGRNMAELREYLPQLVALRYGSLMSGSMVYDFGQGNILAKHPIPTNLALGIVEVGLRNGAMPQVHTTMDSICRPSDLARLDDVHMSQYRSLYEHAVTPVDDIRGYVAAHPGEVLKVNLYHTSAELRQRSFEALVHNHLSLAFAEETSLECTPEGVSKATGLQELCEHLGIALEQVVAVGDAPNDTQALQAAGCAVAMGNATPDIKALADVVVADNDHDGIVEVIDRFF